MGKYSIDLEEMEEQLYFLQCKIEAFTEKVGEIDTLLMRVLDQLNQMKIKTESRGKDEI